MKNKKFLFVADIRYWAYDDAAKNWKRLLKKEYDIDILYLKDYPVIKTGEKGKPIFDHKKYDGVLFFYHRTLKSARMLATKIPKKKVILCINNEKWLESGKKEEYVTYDMKKSKILTGCNKKILKSFKKLHPNIFRVSQSINPKIFKITRQKYIHDRLGRQVIVGWSGNPHNNLKNVDFIKKVCKKAGVTLRIAHSLNRKKLNEWYNDLDIVIISSKSEGGPLCLLEAGACGLPVISTPVGLAKEIIKFRESGIIISTHNIDWFVQAVMLLANDIKLRYKYGYNLRKEINTNWTYEARLYEIKKVLEKI